MTLKARIQEDVKNAMRSRDRERLAALRLITASIKQIEVDQRTEERNELGDTEVLAVLDKMVKQRRDSLAQYLDAGRQDLADKEQFELDIISEYLPEPLGAEALRALIVSTIDEVGAAGMRDMGAVMGALRGQVQGRADMKAVSQAVKDLLAASS
jgi:uncharacterized protein YqeY